MEEVMKAYLAGCLDCDGYFTIKRSTYAMRVTGDAHNPVYSEKIGLKQVKPEVVELLFKYFAGYKRIEKPSARNGKPLFAWSVTDKQAVACISALLPYLRVKREQAELLLQLRESKEITKHIRIVGSNVSPEESVKREFLFNRIKQLNDSRPTNPRLV
jgi:hypothetical protein